MKSLYLQREAYEGRKYWASTSYLLECLSEVTERKGFSHEEDNY